MDGFAQYVAEAIANDFLVLEGQMSAVGEKNFTPRMAGQRRVNIHESRRGHGGGPGEAVGTLGAEHKWRQHDGNGGMRRNGANHLIETFEINLRRGDGPQAKYIAHESAEAPAQLVKRCGGSNIPSLLVG